MKKAAFLSIFLVCLVIFSCLWVPSVKATTAKFGYETIGLIGTGSLENRVRGSVFTCPNDGTANSITAYITESGTYLGIEKAAIYKHSDLSLIGSTTENGAGQIAAWVTFTFSSPPTLIANTEYVLVVWAQSTTGTCVLSYDGGDTNQGHYATATYDGFPNPLVPIHDNNKYSIYCTYTLSAAPTNYVVDLSTTFTFSFTHSTQTSFITDLSKTYSFAFNRLGQATYVRDFSFCPFVSEYTEYTTEIDGSYSDGMLRKVNPYTDPYFDCWNSSVADYNYNTAIYIYVGVIYTAIGYPTPSWVVNRGYLFFDTSSVNGEVLEANLSLYGSGFSEEGHNLTIQNGDSVYPHDPLLLSDFWQGYYSGNGGSIDMVEVGVGGSKRFVIPLNEEGLTWVNNSGGITNLCLRSSCDINYEAIDSYVVALGSRELEQYIANSEPRLTVRWAAKYGGFSMQKLADYTINFIFQPSFAFTLELETLLIYFIGIALCGLAFAFSIYPLITGEEKALPALALFMALVGMALSVLGLSYALAIAALSFILSVIALATRKE